MIFLLTTISEMLYWRLRFYVLICQHVAMDSIGRIGQMELLETHFDLQPVISPICNHSFHGGSHKCLTRIS